MTELVFKLSFAAAAFVIATAGMLSAACLPRRILWFPQGIGTGIVLSAAIVHILPDTAAEIDYDGFPTAYAMAGGALLFLLIVEQITHVHGAIPDALEDMETLELDASGMPSPALSTRSGVSQRRPPSRPSKRSAKGHMHAVVATAALTFHSFFMGWAVGVDVNADTALSTALAVVLHKGLAALALGLLAMQRKSRHSPDAGHTSVRLTELPLPVKIMLLCFTLSTSIGVLVGMAVEDAVGSASAYVMAIGAGMLLHVALFDMVPAHVVSHPHLNVCACASQKKFQTLNSQEIEGPATPLLTAAPNTATVKHSTWCGVRWLLSMALGYAIMTILALWV